MKIIFCSLGKSNEPYVTAGIEDFTARISKYFSVGWQIIPPPKNAASLAEPVLKKPNLKQYCNKFNPMIF